MGTFGDIFLATRLLCPGWLWPGLGAGSNNLKPIFFTLTVDWLQMYYTFINGILMNTIVARIRPDRIG